MYEWANRPTVRHDVACMLRYHGVAVSPASQVGAHEQRVGLVREDLFKAWHIAFGAANIRLYHSLPIRLGDVVHNLQTCSDLDAVYSRSVMIPVCVRTCVRACARACVRARGRAGGLVGVCARVCACVRGCVFTVRECVYVRAI